MVSWGELADRARAVTAAHYDPADRYVVFELGVDDVLITMYEHGQPTRRRWRPTAGDTT